MVLLEELSFQVGDLDVGNSQMGANIAGSHYFAADMIGSEYLEAVAGKCC